MVAKQEVVFWFVFGKLDLHVPLFCARQSFDRPPLVCEVRWPGKSTAISHLLSTGTDTTRGVYTHRGRCKHGVAITDFNTDVAYILGILHWLLPW